MTTNFARQIDLRVERAALPFRISRPAHVIRGVLPHQPARNPFIFSSSDLYLRNRASLHPPSFTYAYGVLPCFFLTSGEDVPRPLNFVVSPRLRCVAVAYTSSNPLRHPLRPPVVLARPSFIQYLGSLPLWLAAMPGAVHVVCVTAGRSRDYVR